MNDSFTFKATLKTTSSQQIFVKAIQTLSMVNKEINILLSPQCMILSTRNSQFSSALKIEFGRQFFDDWYYKPFFLEYGLEGRSDNWKVQDIEPSQEASNSKKQKFSNTSSNDKRENQRIGDCYSFKISALGVLMKNFVFQKGYSKVVNQEGDDNNNSNNFTRENRGIDDSGEDLLEEGEEDIIINKFYDATGETIDFNMEQEKESISSIELLLDNTLFCPQTRINKLKITTRNSSDNRLIKTYMPNIIPCLFENYVIEKRYKCRFGAQYMPQLTKNNDPGFIDIFKDLISLYGLQNLDVDLKKLKLDSKILSTLKNTDIDQKQASLLMPNKEVFEDFENDGVDYSLDDTKLYVNFIKSKLSIWRDITDNMSNSSIEDLHMKIDAKQLVVKSLTKTINNMNENLKIQALDTKNNSNKNAFIDKVASSLLRDGLGVSNAIPSRQLNNTCLALGIDHELTFKFKDFKNFLNLITLAMNTQRLQHLNLLSFLKQQEYREGKKGLTERLNNINSDLINFWFADNPGAPIMMEFNLPTIWKSKATNNRKIDDMVNQVKFKLFLLTDYRISQEKLVQQAIKKSEELEREENGYTKEPTHPLLQLSIKKRQQRQQQSVSNEDLIKENNKHLFIDLEENSQGDDNQKNTTQEEAYGFNYNGNDDFLQESQLNYPEVHGEDNFDKLEFFEENEEEQINNNNNNDDNDNNQSEFVDENGNSYKYDLDKLEQEKQKISTGDSLLKDFNKFQSRKRQFIQLDPYDESFDLKKQDIGNTSHEAVDQLGEMGIKFDAQKSLFKGIFEEAEREEEEEEEQNDLLDRRKTTSIDSEPIMQYGHKEHKGPLNYTEEEEESIGPTQQRPTQSVITKGLLD